MRAARFTLRCRIVHVILATNVNAVIANRVRASAPIVSTLTGQGLVCRRSICALPAREGAFQRCLDIVDRDTGKLR